MRPYRLLALACVVTAAAAAPAPAAFLRSDYLLNGSYTDALGNAPDLAPQGGTLGATDYSFGANLGLSLSNGLPGFSGDYSIALRFRFSTVSGYRKVLDFKDRTSDTGFYVLNSQLNFYPVTTGGAFPANTDADVVLTRNGTTNAVTAYVNGVQAFSFTDSSSLATFSSANNIIHFFRDDNATGGGESSAGKVARIQIYNGALSAAEVAGLNLQTEPSGPVNPVPAPPGLVLAAAGVVPLFAGAWVRRRRTRAAG